MISECLSASLIIKLAFPNLYKKNIQVRLCWQLLSTVKLLVYDLTHDFNTILLYLLQNLHVSSVPGKFLANSGVISPDQQLNILHILPS